MMRSLLEGVGIAVDSIRAAKVRAGLTILGIAIGVMVVMVMSSMVTGINRGVTDMVEQLGPRTFYVFRFFQSGVVTRSSDFARHPALTVDEAGRIADLSSISLVVMEEQTTVRVEYGDTRLDAVAVHGRTAQWLDVYGGDIYPGRSFTHLEDRAGDRTVVVNAALVEEFFGQQNPIGKKVSIANVPFRVVGVYNPPPDIFGQGNQPRAFVPYTALRKHIPRFSANGSFLTFAIKPAGAVTVSDAIDDVTGALRAARGLRPGVDNNFAVVTQDRLLQNFNQTTGVFFLVMIALSSIALLVGGVGVIAVMMISVTERTREIGVRKALGATRRAILWQFLVEAATLTLIGGCVGMLLGGTISYAIQALTPLPAEVPAWALVAAVGAAAFTGIGFGLVPAAKAAALNPVEALRYE